MNKIFALTLLSAAVMVGCSSDDDDDTDGMDPGNGTPGNGTPGGPPAQADMADLPDGADYDPAALETPASLTLADLAASVPSLSTLMGQVGNCDTLNTALADPEARLTVFTPDNDAFSAQAVTDALAEDGADVCDIIAGHVVNGTVASAADLGGDNVGKTVTTMAGTTLTIGASTDTQGDLTIGGANIVGADNFGTNGVAHVIDAVLLPAAETPDEGDSDTDGDGEGEGEGGGDFGAVGTALQANAATSVFAEAFLGAFNDSLDGVSGDGVANTWTVFAPTDAALGDAGVTGADLSSAVLQRHIHTGGSLSESELGAAGTLQMTSGVATYDVTTDADGNVTIAGFPVTVVAAGQSTVYAIDGVLPDQASQ